MLIKLRGALATQLRWPLLAALALKVGLLLAGVFPFNGDEAIVALMARHSLRGQVPTFFYGQAYMGSLDALFVAGGFAIFGEQVWVIRAVQTVLFLLLIWTTFLIARFLFDERVGLLAAWLLAIPTINLAIYSTISLGGYGEAMLIGNLAILLALHLAEREDVPFGWWMLFGGLVGFGVWVLALSLIFTVPAALYLFARRAPKMWIRMLLGMAIGGLIGAAPLVGFILQSGLGEVVREFIGSPSVVVAEPYWLRTLKYAFYYVVLGGSVIFGMRPPWSVDWVLLPAIPLVLFFWGAVLRDAWRRFFSARRVAPPLVLWGVVGMMSAAYVLTPFGSNPTGRYFVPLVVPLAIFAGAAVQRWREKFGVRVWLVFGFILLYQFVGTLQTAAREPWLTTQLDPFTQVDHGDMDALISFLRENGETRGYTNYWVAYPLAFRSQEELIFTPALPYHQDFRYTSRDNRYAPYVQQVADSERVAYITTLHEPLNARLRETLAANGITWQEQQIGDYLVFYDLSAPLRAGVLGFGE